MMFYFYKIVNKINGKKYIGITEDFFRREKEHFSLLEKNKHINYKLQTDYNLYGKENFSFELIEALDFESIELAYDYEEKLIFSNNCLEEGYNIAKGGLLNPMYTNSIKEKMIQTKQSKVPNIYQLIEIKENVFQVINKFNSQKEAQKITGCSQANISKSIKKRIKGSGFYWIEEEQLNNFEQEWKPTRTKITPTALINEKGEILDVHSNQSTFEKELNLPKGSVNQAINKGWLAKGNRFKRISLEEYYSLRPIILIC